MKDDSKSPADLPFHEPIQIPDFDKFEDDLSGFEMFDLNNKKLKIDFDQLSPVFITVGTLTPTYPYIGAGKGISFADTSFIDPMAVHGSNTVTQFGYVRFSKAKHGENILRPNIYVFYKDDYTGEYLVKLYLHLWDAGPYEFNLISKNAVKKRRLVGPGNKIITLSIKNPDHIFCCLQQIPIEQDNKPEWLFFKAVIGRPLLAPIFR